MESSDETAAEGKVVEVGLSNLTATLPWKPEDDRGRALLKTLSLFYEKSAWQKKELLPTVIQKGPHQQETVALLKALVKAKLWGPRVLPRLPFRLARSMNGAGMAVTGIFPLVVVQYADRKPQILIGIVGKVTSEEEIAFMAYAGAWKFGQAMTGVVSVEFDPPAVKVLASGDTLNDLRDRVAAALERAVASSLTQEEGKNVKKKPIGEKAAAAVRKAADADAKEDLEKELEELGGEAGVEDDGKAPASEEETEPAEESPKEPVISATMPFSRGGDAPVGVLNPAGVNDAIKAVQQKKELKALPAIAKSARPAGRVPAPAKTDPKTPAKAPPAKGAPLAKIVITSDGSPEGTVLMVEGKAVAFTSLKFVSENGKKPSLEIEEIRVTSKKVL